MTRLFLLALLLLGSASALTLGPYPVERVVDGDTIVVNIMGANETVRLTGIDTPETVHPRVPVEPYGPEASALARGLLIGRQVALELDERRRDRYGRLLAYVYLYDTQVNLLIVQRGLASPLNIAPNSRYAGLYSAAATGAREVNKGLWTDYPVSTRRWRCRDFATQLEAQAFYGATGPGKRFRLDGDYDNIACERLR